MRRCSKSTDRSRRTGIRGPVFVAAGVVLATLGAAIGACSDEECYQNKNSLPLAGFYGSGPNPKSVSLSNVTVYGLGAPGDSILHKEAASLSQTYLPFRIDQGESSYVFRYMVTGNEDTPPKADTIRFLYKIVPWFVSSACGTVYKYEMESIETTHNEIDSVTCPTGEITNQAVENIRIYFREN